MMAGLGAKKVNSKSIRMTDEVMHYVDNFEGHGFNDKFENLVLFCMKSEAERRKALEYYDDRIASKRAILSRLDKLQGILSDIDSRLTTVRVCAEQALQTAPPVDAK